MGNAQPSFDEKNYDQKKYEIHQFTYDEHININLIHRMNRTAYLLNNNFILRDSGFWIANKNFVVIKRKHTDEEWEIYEL